MPLIGLVAHEITKVKRYIVHGWDYINYVLCPSLLMVCTFSLARWSKQTKQIGIERLFVIWAESFEGRSEYKAQNSTPCGTCFFVDVVDVLEFSTYNNITYDNGIHVHTKSLTIFSFISSSLCVIISHIFVFSFLTSNRLAFRA